MFSNYIQNDITSQGFSLSVGFKNSDLYYYGVTGLKNTPTTLTPHFHNELGIFKKIAGRPHQRTTRELELNFNFIIYLFQSKVFSYCYINVNIDEDTQTH